MSFRARDTLYTLVVVCVMLTVMPGGLTFAGARTSRPTIHTQSDSLIPGDDILERAVAVYESTALRFAPEIGYPRSIPLGTDWMLAVPHSWTSGFFGGVLWQLYDYSGDEVLLEQAHRWTENLSLQATVPSHDVGFIINSSFGKGHLSTGNEWYLTVMRTAAEHLASRFDPEVGAIKAWGLSRTFMFPVIIDSMMNIEILFWAARNGGDESLAETARTHAMTVARDLVRADGSTYHAADYDPELGVLVWQGTVQGLSDTSTWSRGQAWALYGFTATYRETGERFFLDTACSLADAFISRLPEDGVPYWDFDAPGGPFDSKDASAAAIAASGLLELSSLVDDVDLSEGYATASEDLLLRLCSEEYAAASSGLPALLLHSTGNRPLYIDVDVPTIYADYYFVEALIRYLHMQKSNGVLRPSVVSCSPNPFAQETEIRYELPRESTVSVRIYDVSGRQVAEPLSSQRQGPGPCRVLWRVDASSCGVATGVYFCRVVADGFDATGKLVVVR